jgi:hypothetical protein
MADVRTQPVLQDVGSEELRLLRQSYNAMLDAVGDLLDALETAAAIGDVNTAATAFKALIETNTSEIVKIGGLPNIPDAPKRATYVE